MKFVYDDGGREAAGFKGETGDCVCRAIAIATGKPYKEVYDLINQFAKEEKPTKSKKGRSSARTGVYKETIRKVMEHYGWKWTPTMKVGQGCKVHMRADELPSGRVVASLSKHLVCVIDGVIHDTYDSSREETRCVYGYYTKDEKIEEPVVEEKVAEPAPGKKDKMKWDDKSNAAKQILSYYLRNAACCWKEVESLVEGMDESEIEQVDELLEQFIGTIYKRYKIA